jgi:hypothetical protein
MQRANDHVGSVAVIFRPINRFSLRLKVGQDMVRTVFDDVIVDPAPLGATLGTRLNVDVRHGVLSLPTRYLCTVNLNVNLRHVALPLLRYLCTVSRPIRHGA